MIPPIRVKMTRARELKVNNISGSGTGTGVVQVNRGTLGGIGIIAGMVTVGTGSDAGAFLSPGRSATKPGTLTTQSNLTFNSDATYKCALDRLTGRMSKAVAQGVTINGAQFAFSDFGIGTLAVGKIFRVINNISASPIAGSFSNLPNGFVFASNGNNFQASYSGGTGNDLTLTVVP
jgi:hypothetical protein